MPAPSPPSALPTPSSPHRQMWRLAGPMIIANIAVPMLGVVDTAIMGHLPDAKYLGAIAVGSLIFSLLYWGLGFLRMGTTGLVAQARGQLERGGDPAALAALLARAAFIGLLLGLALIVLQRPLIAVLLPLIGPEAAVGDSARTYYIIRIWSAPAALVQFALLGWLLGTQNAKTALLVQVFLNVVNGVLDALFVMVFDMKVVGVALGTVIAEYATVILSAILVLRLLHRDYGVALRPALRCHALFAGEAMARLMRVNTDIFLRTLALMAMFLIFTAVGGRLGTATLAANAVLMNFQVFMAFALDGFAFAAEAMVGADKGALNQARFRASVRVTTLWALIAAVAFTLVYAALGDVIIRLLTDLPEVRAAAQAHLMWIIITPIIAVWSYQFDGIFIGLTRTREMRNTMAAALVVYLLALLVLLPRFGNHGLWAAFTLFLAARGVFMAWCFHRREESFAAS